MNEILLTYIIPVYNTERYVLRCLQSIVNQQLWPDDYEVLVVDDGSTDGSRAVVEAFAAEHRQVKLQTQQNAGVSAARNLAMDNARGRYLMFVDVLSFNYECEDAQGNVLPHSREDNYATTPVVTGYDFLKAHSMTPYVWRFLLRREYLKQGGWRFDPSLIVCEDGALIARFLLNAPRMAHEDTIAYCYVNRSDSAMHNPDKEHLRRRVFSQVDAASSINATARQFEAQTGHPAPASVDGVRNVYLYFSMTKSLTCGMVDEVLDRISKAGLYPFPCVGPEADYHGAKWKIIHRLMMVPGLWKLLSKIYQKVR